MVFCWFVWVVVCVCCLLFSLILGVACGLLFIVYCLRLVCLFVNLVGELVVWLFGLGRCWYLVFMVTTVCVLFVY